MEKDTLIFAINVRTRGKSPKGNGIISIGVCVGDLDGNIKEKRTWHLQKLFPDQEYEPQTSAMHSKTPEDGARPVSECMDEFRTLLDTYDGVYLLCASICASYVNVYLDEFGYNPLHCARDGKSYRPVHDSESYTRGASGAFFNSQYVSAYVEHQLGADRSLFDRLHWSDPANESEHDYRVHLAIVNALQNKK